jgi:hypothetical protein
MESMTIKRSQRWRYHLLCRKYNSCDPTSPDFIGLSCQLHAAKGWEHIPKYMMTAAYVKQQGHHLTFPMKNEKDT